MISRLTAVASIALALVGCANVAQTEKTVVLKDTRTYVLNDGKPFIRNGQPVVTGGEYLTRSEDVCEYHSYRFELTTYQSDDGLSHLTLPETVDGMIVYHCTADGTRLEKKDIPQS